VRSELHSENGEHTLLVREVGPTRKTPLEGPSPTFHLTKFEIAEIYLESKKTTLSE
jgi:hypothetical protein